MRWKTVAIILALLVILITVTWPSRATSYNLLIISVDTLRADRLGYCGYGEANTPHIDKLASEGVVFTRAYSSSPLTLPSHASIMTGVYPTVHGIQDNNFFRLSEKSQTLATILQEYRYQTAATVSAAPLSRETGINLGFSVYDDYLPQQPGDDDDHHVAERRGEDTIAVANRELIRLTRNAEMPFFLWVHLYDPHAEYDPPAEFKEKFSDPYDGEIAYTDFCIGKLLQTLDQTGASSRTIVVFVADHGEGLGDHGEPSHGYFLYDTTMHVPLIMKVPELAPARVTTAVRTIDILPTVLSLMLEKEAPAEVQGQDLSPLMKNREDSDLALPLSCYGETYYPYNAFGWRALRSLVYDGYKYIDTQEGELYDLASDPHEQNNLLVTGEQRMIEKQRDFRDRLRILALNRGTAAVDFNRPMSEIYQVGASQPIAIKKTWDRPCPAKMVEFIGKISLAQTLIWQDKYREALPVLLKVQVKDPDNILCLALLGKAYSKLTEHDKALAAFRRFHHLRPQSMLARNGIIDTLLQKTQYREAQQLIDESLRQDPQAPDAFLFSRRAYLALLEDRVEEALSLADKAILYDAKMASAWFYRGLALEHKLEYREACKAYARTIENKPNEIAAYYHWGYCLWNTNNRESRKQALQIWDKAVRNDHNRQFLQSAYQNIEIQKLIERVVRERK